MVFLFIFLKLLKLFMYSFVRHSTDLIQKEVGCPPYMHLDRHRQTPANTYTDGSPYVMSCSVPRVYILLKFGDFIEM